MTARWATPLHPGAIAPLMGSLLLALALADTGHEREALSMALTALAGHLPRYQRSAANYARLLVETGPDE